MSAAPPHVLAGIKVVRPAGRVAYAGLAAALLASAVALIVVWNVARWQTVAFALGPDLAVLYGIAPGLARGQLHPRAVSLYNALHRFWGPLALAIAALAAGPARLRRRRDRLGSPRRVRPRDRPAAALPRWLPASREPMSEVLELESH